MLAIDAAETKLAEGRHQVAALIDYVHAVDKACMEDVGTAHVLQDPACAASRVVLLWANCATCSMPDLSAREMVERAISDAVSFASQDALMAYYLLIDSVAAMRAIRTREEDKKVACFGSTEVAVHEEARVLERSMHENTAERELHKRLRRRVLVEVDAKEETRWLWARRGLTLMITELVGSACALQFIETAVWQEGWREFWYNLNTATYVLDGVDASPTVVSASCALATATAQALNVTLLQSHAPYSVGRNLELAVGSCLKAALAFKSKCGNSKLIDNFVGEAICGMALAATSTYLVHATPRLELYSTIAIAARKSRSGCECEFDMMDMAFDVDQKGLLGARTGTSSSCLLHTDSIRRQIMRQNPGLQDLSSVPGWARTDYGAFLAECVAIAAITDSITSIESVPDRTQAMLLDLVTTKEGIHVRRELANCFDALYTRGKLTSSLLLSSCQNPVGAYITLTVAGRHLKRGRSAQIGAAMLDKVASDFCQQWTARESQATTNVGLLVDVAVEAAGACSPAIGEMCLVIARDAVLENIKVNRGTGNASENQLVALMSCIAKHPEGVELKRGCFQTLADAWHLHSGSEYLASAITRALPYLSAFSPNRICARLSIVDSLMQPDNPVFSAAAIRFIFARNMSSASRFESLTSIDGADRWWETHGALVASLLCIESNSYDQAASLVDLSLSIIECGPNRYIPQSQAHVWLQNKQCGQLFSPQRALVKLLQSASSQASSCAVLHVRHALAEACRHIVCERCASCYATFPKSETIVKTDDPQQPSENVDDASCRAVIDVFRTHCRSASQEGQSALMAASLAALGSIIEFDRDPKTNLGSWALRSLVQAWVASGFSGLAYAELRRLASRKRIADGVADALHSCLRSDIDDHDVLGLDDAVNAEMLASPEADGIVHVISGDPSPFDELTALVEVLGEASVASGRGGSFALIEALGSLVLWPRRRQERLAIEVPTSAGPSALSRHQKSDQHKGARPSVGYGLTLAVATTPRLLTRNLGNVGSILAAISPYPSPGGDKALVRLRPATCLCEVALSVATLTTPDQVERMARFASEFLDDCNFRDSLRRHVDKLTALLTAELAGSRVQSARSALRLVASSCIDDGLSQAAEIEDGDIANYADEAVRRLFADKFLMVAARVLHHDWDEETSPHNKAARLRCLASVIDYLEPQVATRFAPKIMAPLSAALCENRSIDNAGNAECDLMCAAIDALSRYAFALPTDALQSQLSSIVAVLAPALERIRKSRYKVGVTCPKTQGALRAIEERAADLLRRLVVDRGAEIGFEAIASIPRLPELESSPALQSQTEASLREAHDSFLAAIRISAGPTSSRSVGGGTQIATCTEDVDNVKFLEFELARLASLVDHESTYVQLAALNSLHMTVLNHNRKVGQLVLDPSRRCAASVEAVISSLLRVARKCAKVRDDSLKVACASCVGELGAIDPTRLQSAMLLTNGNTKIRDSAAHNEMYANAAGMPANKIGSFKTNAASLPSPPWEEDANRLMARIICIFLVPALREGADTKGQDSAAYAIQELLKLLRGENDSIPDWAIRCFQSAGCYELVAPYAAAEYVLHDAPRHHRRKKSLGFPEAIKYANQSKKWLSTLTRLLVSRARSVSHGPIFRACRAIIRFDDGLATALLPYLVVDALCCGDDSDTLCIIAELKAIIEIASTAPRTAENVASPASSAQRPGNRDVDPVALQIIFYLHETLNEWCDNASWVEQQSTSNAEGDASSVSSTSASAAKVQSRKRPVNAFVSCGSTRSPEQEESKLSSEGQKFLCFRHPFTCFDAIISEHGEESDTPLDNVCSNAVIQRSTKTEMRSTSTCTTGSTGRIVSQRIEAAVSSLPYANLARAAESIGAYARALMYCERGVKEMSLQYRLNSPTGTFFGDRADGYLPALRPEHIEVLQRLAWRLDRDPDYLAGLAAARGVAGSRATLVQQVREHESEGRWRDALHCYEHILRVHSRIATASKKSVTDDGQHEADALVTRTMSMEDAARGLIQCQLELGHLESAIVNADGFLAEAVGDCNGESTEPPCRVQHVTEKYGSMLNTIAPVAAEAAWRLQRWPKLKNLLIQCQKSKLRSNGPSSVEGDPRLGLAHCIAALHDCASATLPTDSGGARCAPHIAADSFDKEIVSARLEAMAGLSAASMESYARAYPYMARLGALRELEQAKSLIDISSLQSRESYYRDHLAPRWDARLRSAAAATQIEMLALRRTCLELVGLTRDAADCSELSARLARKAGSVTLAQSDLREAARLGASSDAIQIAEAKLALVNNNPSSALCAYAMLEPVELDVRATRARFGLLDYHEGGGAANTSLALVASREGGPLQRRKRELARRALAKRLVLATDCLVDAQMRHGADVVQRYKLAIDLRPKWDRAYFGCARVFDNMLASRRRELVDAAQGAFLGEVGSGAAFADGVCNFDAVAHEHAKAAIRHYSLCLEHSAKYAETALPRLLTLCFEFAAIDSGAMADFSKALAPSGTTSEDGKRHEDRIKSAIASLRRLQAAIIETVKHVRKNVRAAVIYGAVQQILSRAGHPHPDIRDGVLQLLSKVLEMHPQRALYAVSGLLHSTNHARQAMGTKVLATAISCLKRKSGCRQHVVSLEAARTFFKDLISLARLQIPGTFDSQGRKFTQRVELSKKVFKMTPVGNATFVVPTRSALTPELQHAEFYRRDRCTDCVAAAQTTSRGIEDSNDGDDGKHVPWPNFPNSAPRIARVDDWVTVLGTKAAPKKISFITTDGAKVDALCKCETDGDFRKDARVQDFNDIVNRLLSRDSNSQRRKLRLRTYTVVILDEQCGLCEWMTDTLPLRSLIKMSYALRKKSRTEASRHSPTEVADFNSPAIKQAWSLITAEQTLKGKITTYKRLVLSRFSPCLSVWFERAFSSEPAAWLEARTVYARSVATWSAVGYLIGLGDRHSENILLDTKSGECVHVDFDCLFDKGASLKVPERVPFRLTTHVVEALGITGVDGCFRRSLESVLATLRDNKETLLNVLEPFLRDPTVGWTRLGKAQDARDSLETESGQKPPAQKRLRLRGPGDGNQNDEEGRAAWHLGIISQRLSGIVIFPVPKAPRRRDSRANADDKGSVRRELRRKDKKDENGNEHEKTPTDLLPLSVAGQVRQCSLLRILMTELRLAG